jgi:hypothetical protein
MGRQIWGCSLSNLREHAGHDQGHRGLEAETLAQTEDAVLELTLLLNAEIRVTEIILQALLFLVALYPLTPPGRSSHPQDKVGPAHRRVGGVLHKRLTSF